MKWIACLLGQHEWTCDAEEGIDPPKDIEPSIASFFRYARMWCRICRRYCKPSPSMPGSEHWDRNVTHRPELPSE